MLNFKKILALIVSLLLFIALFLYFSFLFVLPNLVNNHFSLLQDFFFSKYKIELNAKTLYLKTTPTLKIFINSSEFSIIKKDNFLIFFENIHLNANIFDFSKTKFVADYMKLSFNDINISNDKKKNSIEKKIFSLNKLPSIDVNKLDILYKGININASDFKVDSSSASFVASIKTPFLDNELIIGNKGCFYFIDDNFYAKDFRILLQNSKLDLNGLVFSKNKTYDFTVKGEGLPINEIQKTLLFYQKSQDPAKKFIENFYNFNGFVNVDLRVDNSGLFGSCIGQEVSANAVWFKIPLYFKEVILNFDKDRITSVAEGIVADHNAVHTLDITNLGTSKKDVMGSFRVILTDKFLNVPDLKILNSANAKIKYNINNNLITVDYNLDLPIGSDLLYKNAFLGLRDKKRRFYAQTLKEGDDLKLSKYDYSLIENNKIINIILGDGLFKKVRGKYTPQFVTCKTNGFAPVSVTGSFGKYVSGGEFNGELKYDFLTTNILGNFEIINTRFKNYLVKSAKIFADKTVLLTVNGKFHNQDFNGKIEAKNQLGDAIYVYNLDLFLDKFIIRKGKKSTSFNPQKIKQLDFSSKFRDFDVTIENWKIRINEIQKDRLFLNNIELFGSLKNDMFNFIMKDLSFAKGILSGRGQYNFRDDSSSIDFIATGIDSNSVADVLFNLKGQIQGVANATLKVKTKNKLQHISAHGEFKLDNGFLPKLGSTEFMIMNNKKVKVSDLVNIDFSKKKALESDIKGSFDLNDSLLKNIKITSQQSFLSLFINGQYDIDKQFADVSLFGKYNKEAPKGVKILFVPLEIILKVIFRPENSYEKYKKEIAQIPMLKTCEANQKLFRVKLKGDLSKDKVDVQIKGIEK